MYQLLNKDVVLASFDITKDDECILNLKVVSRLPIGVTTDNFMNWIEGRFAAKHRKHLVKYLHSIGAYDIRGFIKVSHCISINDTYWIKESTENIHWCDVSPYTNDFDEVVQSIAFDGKWGA